MADDDYLREARGLPARMVGLLEGKVPAIVGLVAGVLAGIEYVRALGLPSHEFGSPAGILLVFMLTGVGGAGLVGLVLLVFERTRGVGCALYVALAVAIASWLAMVVLLPR